jgi:hypothetical protein
MTIVRLLLGKGVNINMANLSGKTALDLAAENLQEKVVRLLLERGAEVKGRFMKTSFPKLLENNDEVVMRLLEKGFGAKRVGTGGNLMKTRFGRRLQTGTRRWCACCLGKESATGGNLMKALFGARLQTGMRR